MAALGAGVTLGELEAGAPLVDVSMAAPTASQSSTLSLAPPPPRSRSPSSGSGVSRPSPSTPAMDLTARPARALPRRVGSSSVPTVVPYVLVPKVPDAYSSISRPASAADSPAARPPKRAAVEAAPPAFAPMKSRPAEWLTCALCRRRKVNCRPPVGAKSPYKSCSNCLNQGATCVPHPVKKRGSKKASPAVKSKAPATHAAPAAPASPKGFYAGIPIPLEPEDPFPTSIPPLPLPTNGIFPVPFSMFAAWRAEIFDADREYDAANFAVAAAAVRLDTADIRRRLALNTYIGLLERVGEPEDPPFGLPNKGKSRASPVTIEDSDAEGSADEGRSGSEGGDDGASGDAGAGGTMDMS